MTDELCPDCGRQKAKNVGDAAAGMCPKWWAIRDAAAERDCEVIKLRAEGDDTPYEKARGEETIVAAAMRAFGAILSVPAPGRHGDIFNIYSHTTDDEGLLKHGGEQGFLTSSGRFVDRREAVIIAQRAGQITELRWPPKLYSEDLW